MFFSRAMFLPAWRESIKTTLVADLSKAITRSLARGKRIAVEMFAEVTMTDPHAKPSPVASFRQIDDHYHDDIDRDDILSMSP